MESIKISLPKGKYISDIELFLTNGIPNNSQIFKEVPGCGITSFAISRFRSNLICGLPNVPVIESKVKDHNEKRPRSEHILGVYKGVDIDDIKAYLLDDEVVFKKILTTPEGFISKVMKAFKDPQVMYDQFFFLIDESERMITDVSYRGAIAIPLEPFFRFKRKALVSATPLPFSDERLKTFTNYVIVPEYKYAKPITVVNTNNVVASIKQQLDKLNSEHVCIFINSTSGINAIAKNLDLTAESKAFCAKDSVVKLREKGFRHASANFDVKDMAKYNFFTSRYFSAIDMIVDYKPDVIMVTDVFFADHSILDPHTEVIQIPGRFRNGINSLTHITNFNPSIKVKSKEDALNYLEGCFDTHDGFVDDYNNSKNPGSRDELHKAILGSIAFPYYYEGKRNMAMVDNFIYQERVKGYYQRFENLKAAYEEKPLHYNLTYQDDAFPVGDRDLYNLSTRQTKTEKYKAIAELLHQWTSSYNRFVLFADELRNKLVVKHPKIAEAVRVLGLAKIEELGYDAGKISKAIPIAKRLNEIKRIAPFVYALIDGNDIYPEHEVMSKFTEAYIKAKTDKIPHASHVLKYFAGRRSQAGGINVYHLKEQVKPGSR